MTRLLLLLSILSLNVSTAFSQVTDILSGLTFPYDCAFYGNDLYVTELGAGRVIKVDITAPVPPTIEVVLTGLSNPAAMTISGDFLYYAESGADRVSRLDLTQTNPMPEVVVSTGLQTPNDLFVDGNFLYITDEGNDRFLRADLTVENPIPETVASGLVNPLGIAKFGDDFYLSIFGSSSIVKVDISETPAVVTTIISGLSSPAGITVDGSFLYVAENGLVARIDLNATTPTAETVVMDGIMGSRNVAFDGIDMYIAQTGGTFGGTGLISRLTIGTPVFSNLPDVCSDDMPTMLGGASPSSGTYSGPGVTDNGDGNTFSFDPTAAGGVGMYNVTYTLGSGSMTSTTLTVVEAPTVTFSTGNLSVQVDAGVQTGLGGGMPAGGVYSGNGVTDDGNGMTYSFDPAAAGEGENVITYTFEDANGCDGEQGAIITVTPAIVPGDLCAEAIDISSLFGAAFNEPQVSTLYDNTVFVDGSGDPAAGFDCFYGGDGLDNTGWFSFIGDGNTYRMRSVQCTGPNENLDLQVVIYSGGCEMLMAGACNEDEDGANGIFNFNVEFTAEDGVEYLALVDGYQGAAGQFCLEVTNLTEPIPGAALDFDGENNRVDIGQLQLTGAFTIEAWVKPDEKFDLSTILANKTGGLEMPGYALSINDFQSTDRRLVLETQGVKARTDEAVIEWGVWQHIAVSTDGSTATFYVNGEEQAATMTNQVSLGESPNPTDIGDFFLYFANGKYDGAMDEVRIWNRELSCFEVDQLRNCELVGNEEGLIAYYQFNQGIAAANNTSITELVATTGNNGSLSTFTLTGETSNFVTPGGVTTGVMCGPVNTATLVSVNGNEMVIPNGDESPSFDDGTDFGDIAIGQTGSEEFHIIADGVLGFNGITVDNPAFVIGAVNPQTGMFPISFTPTETGEQLGVVSVHVDDCTIDDLYTYTIRANGVAAELPGDECPDAIDINNLFGQAAMVPQLSEEYDNTGYSVYPSDPTDNACGFNYVDSSPMWFAFTGDGNRYSISSEASIDVAGTLYSGECDNRVEVACNDDNDGTDFGFEIQTETGVQYLLIVSSLAFNETGTFNIEVTNLGTVGVQDIRNTAFNVYPNPTNGWVQLDGFTADHIEVLDQLGRTVRTQGQAGNGVDLSGLPAGVYVLRMQSGTEVYSAKVVKE